MSDRRNSRHDGGHEKSLPTSPHSATIGNSLPDNHLHDVCNRDSRPSRRLSTSYRRTSCRRQVERRTVTGRRLSTVHGFDSRCTVRNRTLGIMTGATTARPGRNEPCYCGSGKKYKQCCLAKDEAEAAARRAAAEAAERAEVATAPEASAEAAAAPMKPAPTHAPKHQTHQPWKATTSRGFAPKNRTPRKAGGS